MNIKITAGAWKPERKRTLGRPRHGWEDNIKMKILCEFLFSPIHVVARTHHFLPDLIKLIFLPLEVQIIKFLYLYFSPPFRYWTLLGPNFLLQ